MKCRTLLCLAVAFAAAGTTGAAFAADVKVIANPSVGGNSLSADELKAIFLATKSSLEGGTVEPVFERGGAVHEAFLKTYLGKTGPALDTYYRSLAFTGKGSLPKTLSGDADVVAYVAKTKGAIGYVSSAASPTGVKVLQVK